MDHREALNASRHEALPDADERRRRERLKRFAGLMDTRFRVPGTEIRFGLDPVIGLIPGIGDSATALASLWVVYEARRLGASTGLVAHMLWNIGLELVVGTIPLIGDLFDLTSRANDKNVTLLERQLIKKGRRRSE